MERKIKMFGTHNDTDKWAVCVDGFFGLFDSKDEAVRVWNKIGGTTGSDGLADTAFGSAAFLTPHKTIKYIDGSEPDGGFDRVSSHKPINIEDYIVKVPIRLTRRIFDQRETTKERFITKRFFKDLCS